MQPAGQHSAHQQLHANFCSAGCRLLLRFQHLYDALQLQQACHNLQLPMLDGPTAFYNYTQFESVYVCCWASFELCPAIAEEAALLGAGLTT